MPITFAAQRKLNKKQNQTKTSQPDPNRNSG